jgi:hypothetical protein
MMHKSIKKYTHDGFIRDDADFPRLRAELERLTKQQMKEEGYVPVYELNSFWSTSYEPEDKRYTFKLTMYACFAGKVKALQFNYWQNGKLV